MVMKFVLDEGAYEPTKGHLWDAGYDLKSKEKKVIYPNESALFDTGIHFQIPHGYCGCLISKSGLNVKHSVLSTGLIDSEYTGPVKVKLYNHGEEPIRIEVGDKISQIVFIPCASFTMEQVNELEETERGSDGFGSTGK